MCIRDSCGGLKKLHKQHSQGQWSISLEEEDVHGALEARLIELIGPAGGRMHLGRSRNDQVLVALRLYLKDATNTLQLGAEAVSDSLEALAKRQGDIPLPGYTHMQPAMPSSVGLWAKGFSAEIRDDARGLNVAKSRADFNPLGSAAGYGTPGININRESTTKQLGFSSAHEPVTAVQLSRGKAEATLTFEIALLLGDLSRLASDLLLFYTSEFAFISLPHEMTTGSSIMPQKRNPDVLELITPRTKTLALLEDNCFIGARSEIVEGVIVEKGSVISMGVYIGQSTKIYDRETGNIIYGRVPAGSVVVSGSLPSEDKSYNLYLSLIHI